MPFPQRGAQRQGLRTVADDGQVGVGPLRAAVVERRRMFHADRLRASRLKHLPVGGEGLRGQGLGKEFHASNFAWFGRPSLTLSASMNQSAIWPPVMNTVSLRLSKVSIIFSTNLMRCGTPLRWWCSEIVTTRGDCSSSGSSASRVCSRRLYCSSDECFSTA